MSSAKTTHLVPAWLKRSLRRLYLMSCLGLFSCVAMVEAQVTGSISGYLKDPSGAAMPVSVTAVMVEQQVTRKVQTDPEGFDTFVAMLPGDYQISFEAGGFKLARSGVRLTVNENIRVDGTLTLGSVETRSECRRKRRRWLPVSPTLSGLVDDRRVVDLPLNGRTRDRSLRVSCQGVPRTWTSASAPGDARGGPE